MMSVGKKFESSGCEIQRWIEKGFSFTEYCLPQHSSCAHGSAFSFAIFVGFVGLGHKMVKLYIFAPKKQKKPIFSLPLPPKYCNLSSFVKNS